MASTSDSELIAHIHDAEIDRLHDAVVSFRQRRSVGGGRQGVDDPRDESTCTLPPVVRPSAVAPRRSTRAPSPLVTPIVDLFIRSADLVPAENVIHAGRGPAATRSLRCLMIAGRAASTGHLAVTNTLALLRLLPLSDHDKDVEILALRHQLGVPQRQLGARRPRFEPTDLAFLAALLHRLPTRPLRELRLLARPDTILRWHRDLLAAPHASGPGRSGPDGHPPYDRYTSCGWRARTRPGATGRPKSWPDGMYDQRPRRAGDRS